MRPRVACLLAVLLISAGQSPAKAQTNSVAQSVTSTLLNVLGGSSGLTLTPTPTPSPTPSSTPTPTPSRTPSPTPTPSTTPSPTPRASPSPSPTPSTSSALTTAATAPSPANANATALTATLQLQGSNLWPFTNAAAIATVQALSQSLTSVTISAINILNATQEFPSKRLRSLLGANDTVNLYLELEGSSPQAALSINTDLGNSVLNGALQFCRDLFVMQRTLARNGVIAQSLSLIYSNAAVPQVQFVCSSGSFQGVCTSDLNQGLSTGKIVAIAAGTGAGVLVLLAICVACILKCARKKVAGRVRNETITKKVMTPQHAQPYWEQNERQAQETISVSATPGTAFDAYGNPVATALPSGQAYAEMKEMGGKQARDQLKMKLPEFAARTRTGSGVGGVHRSSSNVSRTTSINVSFAPPSEGDK